jgi:hypothetical protein
MRGERIAADRSSRYSMRQIQQAGLGELETAPYITAK